MIDIEKIKAKIEIIRENVGELKAMRNLSLEDLTRSKRDLAAAKHFIRVAIEAMIDLGTHIVVKEMLGAPSSNREVILVLAEKGVISQGNIFTFLKMVKYRNRLVHFYHEVSTPEIYNIIQNRLEDFERFIGDISTYLEKIHR